MKPRHTAELVACHVIEAIERLPPADRAEILRVKFLDALEQNLETHQRFVDLEAQYTHQQMHSHRLEAMLEAVNEQCQRLETELRLLRENHTLSLAALEAVRIELEATKASRAALVQELHAFARQKYVLTSTIASAAHQQHELLERLVDGAIAPEPNRHTTRLATEPPPSFDTAETASATLLRSAS